MEISCGRVRTREFWVYISKDHVGLLQYEILEAC
jgi:hypothetical protein